jgi:hypothetical protein
MLRDLCGEIIWKMVSKVLTFNTKRGGLLCRPVKIAEMITIKAFKW